MTLALDPRLNGVLTQLVRWGLVLFAALKAYNAVYYGVRLPFSVIAMLPIAFALAGQVRLAVLAFVLSFAAGWAAGGFQIHAGILVPAALHFAGALFALLNLPLLGGVAIIVGQLGTLSLRLL